jgi:hypothetical protein
VEKTKLIILNGAKDDLDASNKDLQDSLSNGYRVISSHPIMSSGKPAIAVIVSYEGKNRINWVVYPVVGIFIIKLIESLIFVATHI